MYERKQAEDNKKYIIGECCFCVIFEFWIHNKKTRLAKEPYIFERISIFVCETKISNRIRDFDSFDNFNFA